MSRFFDCLLLSHPSQLDPLDPAILQQKPNVNAVTTLEKVIEIQSKWEHLGTGWGSPILMPTIFTAG